MGKVTRVRKKLVGSAVFLKLVRPLVFSDPTCAENRVGNFFSVLGASEALHNESARTVLSCGWIEPMVE